jgi:hypothetical protein
MDRLLNPDGSNGHNAGGIDYASCQSQMQNAEL